MAGTSRPPSQELEATLDGEIDTLGYPKAALFAFCVALVAYNVMSTVKAALRSAHGAEVITEEFSGYYLADEVRMSYRGMMRAIPKDEWVEFQEMPAEELAEVLVAWGGRCLCRSTARVTAVRRSRSRRKQAGRRSNTLRHRRY